jgi:hypothetical protein
VTAETESTPLTAADPSTKRHRPRLERGVLSLAAIGAVALMWLGLSVPGIRLAPPGVLRDATQTPVIAQLTVGRDAKQPRRESRNHPPAAGAPASHAHTTRTDAGVSGTTAGAGPAPPPAPEPAPSPPAAPGIQPVVSGTPSAASTPEAPTASAPTPEPSSPPQLTSAVSQVLSTASTIASAVPPASGVAAATQEVTSAVPVAPPLQP